MSFIQANLDKYTVKQMCSALKFPISTYYTALNHVPSKREQEYKEFSNQYITNLRNVIGQLISIENLMIEISPAR